MDFITDIWLSKLNMKTENLNIILIINVFVKILLAFLILLEL